MLSAAKNPAHSMQRPFAKAQGDRFVDVSFHILRPPTSATSSELVGTLIKTD